MSPNGQERDLVTPIAVVGMSFRGPGDASTTEGLLRMVAQGRESRSTIPEQKWNHDAFYHPDPKRYGTHNVEYGHWFQQNVYEFDAPFFNLSAPEAAALDPQQRMLLECSYEAFENSGTPLSRVVGTETSVFAACFCTDYTDMLWRDPESVPMYQCTNSGFSRANVANRISYSFDLKGPSVTVDTACSGGLAALHLGCQSLLTGDAKQAIVAGSSVVLGPEVMTTMSMMRFLSPDGRCYTFDERANGYARGEGVAVLFLKRLDDALADGDTVRAVIRGTSCNQDGKTPGITMPNSLSQEALIRSVYEKTGLDPVETTYVECHGTGTQAGDTTETGAITTVFGPGRKLQDPLVIGSVKTNIGHLEAASGLAGVMKSILMLENGIILPHRNFERANPRIPLKEWNLRVPTTVEPWTRRSVPRRASVNSFGYGGANIHAIVESAEDFLLSRGIDPSIATRNSALAVKEVQDALDRGYTNGHSASIGINNGISNGSSTGTTNGTSNGVSNGIGNGTAHRVNNGISNGIHNGYSNGTDNGNGYHEESNDQEEVPNTQLFVLSAFDPAAGEAWAAKLVEYVSQREGVEQATFLESLSITLSDRRTIHPWKAVVAASTSEELIARLKMAKFVNVPPRKNIGFVFTGQGAQWCGMGKELITASRSFRESLKACGEALERIGASFDILDELQKDFETSQVNKAIYSQPLCTALQIALVDMLNSWGVRPDSVTGHSSGEIAAAYAVGALSLEDAMLVSYARGLASSDLAKQGVKGAMTAVGMAREDLSPILSNLKNGKAVIACWNSPSSITVSGDASALNELQQVLRAKGIYNRRLVVEVAYHSHHMALVADRYRNDISRIKAHKGNGIKFFSSVTGKPAETSTLGTEYWVSNLVGEVKFAQSLHQLAIHGGSDSTSPVQTLVEVGPHAALAGPIKQILDADEGLAKSTIEYLSVLVRKKDAEATALDLASNLFMSGHDIRLSAVSQHSRSNIPPLIDLPPYAWNHTKTHTAESRISRAYRERPFPRADILGVIDSHSSALEPRWRQFIRLSEMPWVRDHHIHSSIVYPGAGYIAMAIEAARQRALQRAAGTPIVGYQFRDVAINTALVIPESPGEVEVVITLKSFSESVRSPSNLWDEFSVSSVSNENRWTEHCRGLIAIRTPPKSSNPVNGPAQEESDRASYQELVTKFESDCQMSADVGQFYEQAAQIGMAYGPTFANLRGVRSAPGRCIGRVEIPDTAAVMPMQYEHPFVIHPATLDTIFQTYLPALAVQRGHFSDAVVPVSIEDMFIAHDVTRRAGDMLTSYTSTSRKDYRFTSSTMNVFEGAYVPGKMPVVHIGEMTLAALDRYETAESENEVPPRAFNMKWAPDVSTLTQKQLMDVCWPPKARELTRKPNEGLDQTAQRLLREAIAKVPEQQSKLAGEHAHGLWKLVSAQVEQSQAVQGKGADSHCEEVNRALHHAASKLPDVLVGQMTPSDFAKEYDLESLVATPGFLENNQAAATYLHLLAHKKPDLTMLTVGPQSGPASLSLLNILYELGGGVAPFTNFHHADAEINIDELTKTKFPDWADSIAFRDIKAEGGAQETSGGLGDAYDVVVAFNVLGSSGFLSKTLMTASKLLIPGGKLVLVNHAPESPVATLLWGPLPSFLSSQKDSSVSMSSSMVDRLVQKTSFTTHAGLSDGRSSYGVLFLDSSAAKNGAGRKVPDALIVADEGQGAVDLQRLQALCEELGASTEVVPLEHADPKPEQACIVLSDLTRHVLAAPKDVEWEAVKKMGLGGAGLLWVTRGAETGGCPCLDPEASLVQGMTRTIRSETGDRPIVTLDLDGGNQLDPAAAASCIADVFGRMVGLTDGDEVADWELAERGGILHVPRLVEDVDASEQLQADDGSKAALRPQRLGEVGASRLFVGTPGLLDSLHFAPDERAEGALQDGQVEVEVKAAGINFKDVMMAMGQIQVEDLGCECSGVVSAVGSQVEADADGLRVGDRVLCLGSGAFCTRLRSDARLVQRMPDSLAFEAAAALPITYVTAYHSLHNIARIRRGERILIHAATGGLGQALLELSQLAEADIYVTVGSAEKKRFVVERFGLAEERILFSRDTSFARAIMRLTNGRGVDVVMNSLAGEALRQSWACIAPYGRFVELGQRDITINTRLDMAPFVRNASFTAYNLAYTLQNDPAAAREVLGEVLALYEQGTLQGPSPLETYAFSQIEQAFRTMQTGRHMGKLVAVAQPDDVVKFNASRAALFRSDASYLLVGGLGGLGRATALWMAGRGARHLILLNRSGASGEAARDTVAALRQAGCSATLFGCDIADPAQLASVLAAARQRLPPIRGVIQGAMVLRDAMLANMALHDYLAVLRPKLHGTWNLHKQLPHDLDFFLMESSISGIVGNTSQAAYAAANTFLDAFACYRRSRGQPATTVNLGAVSGIGYLARNDELKQAMERQGFDFTDEPRLMRLLEFAIGHSRREPEQAHIITGLGAWHPDGSLPALNAPVFSRYRILSSRSSHTRNANDTLRKALKQSASLPVAIDIILAALVGQIVARTGVPPENVSTSTKSLQDYGIDSLAAVELRNWLSKEMESTVPIFELLAAESLAILAAKIASRSRLISNASDGKV